MRSLTLALLPAVFALVAGCSTSSNGSSGASGGGGSSGGPGTGPGTDGGATATDGGGGGSSGGADGGDAPARDAAVDSAISSTTPVLPKPTGTCPTLAAGDVTFAPAGMPPRKVTLSMTNGAKTAHGPLILYWYATGSSVAEVPSALGATLTAIQQAGGIVAAPHADPSAGQFEWFAVNGSTKQDDFLLADEIVACVAQSTLLDATRIHSMGFSAGALQTTALSFQRAAYIASVATFSGGMPPDFTPTNENPPNEFAGLLFHGGTSDNVYGVDFQAATQRYQTTLTGAGHFAAICNHGGGHAIPKDAAPSVAAFFTANPFGAWPSPYTNGLPTGFPAYCTR